ncbi:hypothetical protein ACPFP2_06070 [Micromonospora citrea]|uniref:hypothetical protein n=1 Tax=Micromonospora citrea TaxID=47855 RepID=UPI003C50DBBD
MTGIPLATALTRLRQELGSALSDGTADRFEVELAVVAERDGDQVRWRLAGAGDDAPHRVTVTLSRPVPAVPSTRSVPARPRRRPPLPDDEEIGEDILGELPPIVRPKPGYDGGDRDE